LRWAKCGLHSQSINDLFHGLYKVYARNSTLDGIRNSLLPKYVATNLPYAQTLKKEQMHLKVQFGVEGHRVVKGAAQVEHNSLFRNTSDLPLHVRLVSWHVHAEPYAAAWIPLPKKMDFTVPPHQTVMFRSVKLTTVRRRDWRTGIFPQSNAPVHIALTAWFFNQLDSHTALPAPVPQPPPDYFVQNKEAIAQEEREVAEAAFVRDGGAPIPVGPDVAHFVHQALRKQRLLPTDLVVPFNATQKLQYTESFRGTYYCGSVYVCRGECLCM
jgi:hypothetical protein